LNLRPLSRRSGLAPLACPGLLWRYSPEPGIGRIAKDESGFAALAQLIPSYSVGRRTMPTTQIPPALREKYPNLEAFWPFLQTLREESPRGTVLISCGFLEQQLKEFLLAFMVDDAAVGEFI
jgi:hypothetical protein